MIRGNLDVKNAPAMMGAGFEVVINDFGTLWHYGIYDTKKAAEEAVEQNPEYRFIIERASTYKG